jgi:AcrR family transcriptional regulator
MMPSKDEIIKCEVLQEAAKLFRHYGLSKTTMEDIARAVGKGKSTLYYYYKSKEEIFDAVMQREKDAMLRRIQVAVEQEPTASLKLEAFTRMKFREIAQISVLYQIVVREVQNCTEMERGIRKSFDNNEMSLVKGILQFGVDNGEFSNIKDIDLELMAFVMMSAQRGVEIASILTDRLEEIEATMDALVNIMLNGIRNF